MSDTLSINGGTIRLIQDDITLLKIDSFVYYARHDLNLGSGFGGAISIRGGPSIQEELKDKGSLETTDVYVSGAGDLEMNYIVHAVGPRFQEEDLNEKLEQTIAKTLSAAEEKGINSIAFPPMGSGFYGVPIDVSAEITLKAVKEYLSNNPKIKDIVVCANDRREYQACQNQLRKMGG
ncbi:MAG: macro domain-containing protein [candidate division Zixibacteria bacterium]